MLGMAASSSQMPPIFVLLLHSVFYASCITALAQLLQEFPGPRLDPLLGEVYLMLEIEGQPHEVVAPLPPRGGVQVAGGRPGPYQTGAGLLSSVSKNAHRVLVSVLVEDLVARAEEAEQLAAQVERAERVELLPPGRLQLANVPGRTTDQEQIELEHDRQVQIGRAHV